MTEEQVSEKLGKLCGVGGGQHAKVELEDFEALLSGLMGVCLLVG